ncbi:MAG: 4Fe-4S dicluster domain-containing protein [Oscillospiraceae bacterium]|nr:4Fe-4S dicluster domain-containing protein [Oscillospiraceae bacterium]
MQEMANVYFYGKRYSVPADLTIMTAMEYAGYQLLRGCGCRYGFCGACAIIYRVAGSNTLQSCLACQTQVQDGMYVATLPYFPTVKKVYDMETVKPEEQLMMQLYPEIYACIGCNACTKACSKELNVMQYIAYAQRNELEKCANESFDCVSCGICASRCPAGISHPMVGLLARRLVGKYIQPEAKHMKVKAASVRNGELDAIMAELLAKPLDEIKELYNARDIEK